jgi:hypothetical protein
MTPSKPHENCVTFFNTSIIHAIERLQTEFNLKALQPKLGIQYSTSCNMFYKSGKERGIVDCTLYINGQKGVQNLMVIEVAMTEGFTHAEKKVKSLLASDSQILGAIVLKIKESPLFHSPKAPKRLEKTLATTELFMENAVQKSDWGPITYLNH